MGLWATCYSGRCPSLSVARELEHRFFSQPELENQVTFLVSTIMKTHDSVKIFLVALSVSNPKNKTRVKLQYYLNDK